MATVETGARLHFGFQNLSLAHERLYGGIGVALAEPRLVVEAERDDGINCQDDRVAPYADRVVAELGVPGARVSFREGFDRHVGLGSGTQLALACLRAVAAAYDREVSVRGRAPALERGGRSGVGVATFERGGFVVDAGHPTERFTSDPPEPGAWQVPDPIAAWPLAEEVRFVVVTPDVAAGRSGDREEDSMRRVVERADPGIGDQIATLVMRRLLPAVVKADVDAFGSAVARLGRLNGAWYADEQGGVYRPPAGRLIQALGDSPVVAGAGQSSWGPTVYGVTRAGDGDTAAADGRSALDDLGLDGTVRVVAPRNRGAIIER
jgi:beta-ribofuranosylaminobenzene 5'-phosphate synthase